MARRGRSRHQPRSSPASTTAARSVNTSAAGRRVGRAAGHRRSVGSDSAHRSPNVASRLRHLQPGDWVEIAVRNAEQRSVRGRYRRQVGQIIWLKWGAGWWAIDIRNIAAIRPTRPARRPQPR